MSDIEYRLGDFYTACDGQHREFFSAVLHEWREAGLPWSCRDGKVMLYLRSSGRDLDLFFLDGGGGSTLASLTCDLAPVRVRLGDAEADRVLKRMQEVRGLDCRFSSDTCTIFEPANASGSSKHALISVVRRLAAHLPGVLTP
ncbi:MAG TPA: hypothetical protein VJ961_05375 [Mariprofundaceae bacterium]|nr:hypothetical protein [Mariprofundaceae bacterium]